MRRVSITGLLLTIGFILGTSLSAQTGKEKEKEKEKSKEVKKEGVKGVDEESKMKFQWPKEIGGKKLDDWVKDMRDERDASLRETAIRTVPMFGPDSQKAASANLLYAITKDTDFNVRLAAVSTVPSIGFDAPQVNAGLNAMIEMLKNSQSPLVRLEVINALGNCGPVANIAIPTFNEHLGLGGATPREVNAWQNRKAIMFALGRLGMPTDPNMPPDPAAFPGLLRGLHDSSHLVKREALQSLLMLGPPMNPATLADLRKALIARFQDKDKSVVLWARVLYLQTEQKTIDPKQNKVLLEIGKHLEESDTGMRLEGIQAIGSLGEGGRFYAKRLREIAVTPKEDKAVVLMALWALSGMKSEMDANLKAFNILTQSEDKEIKEAAKNAAVNISKKDEPTPDPKKDPKKDKTP